MIPGKRCPAYLPDICDGHQYIVMRQLAVYYTLTCIISWLIWLPLYGPALGLSGVHPFPFQHALGGLGPLIAAFITTGMYSGKSGVRLLLARTFRWRPLLYLVVALVAPFIIYFIASVIGHFKDGAAIIPGEILVSKEFPDFPFWLLLCYNLVFFGFGEEVGWRGLALPALEQKFHPVIAAFVLTLFWAVWHWPLFLYRPGYVSMGAAGIAGWFFSLLTGSVILSWLYEKTSGSILVCAVFHSTIDIVFTADLSNGAVVGYMGFLITLWGLATVLLLRKRKPSIGDGEHLNL